MGLFLTALASDLSPEELKKEKQQMVKIGRMGVSDRAVFLSSMLADRSRYVLFSDMNRIFKQVAMSKGGFTGKGVFGSMAEGATIYNTMVAYPIGIIVAVLFLLLFLRATKKPAVQA